MTEQEQGQPEQEQGQPEQEQGQPEQGKPRTRRAKVVEEINPFDPDAVAAYIERHGIETFQRERLRQNGTVVGAPSDK